MSKSGSTGARSPTRVPSTAAVAVDGDGAVGDGCGEVEHAGDHADERAAGLRRNVVTPAGCFGDGAVVEHTVAELGHVGDVLVE